MWQNVARANANCCQSCSFAAITAIMSCNAGKQVSFFLVKSSPCVSARHLVVNFPSDKRYEVEHIKTIFEIVKKVLQLGCHYVHKEITQSCRVGIVVVIFEASAPKVYRRVTLGSANTLSGSVVRTLTGRERLPKMFCLVASSLGH